MGFRTGLLAALILASGCAAPLVLDEDEALVTVPHLVGSQGHIIVQAMINDKGPFRFALDTGASISVVFEKTREQASLNLVDGEKVLVHGMIGIGEFPITTIGHLQVGGESWRDARVASLLVDDEVSAEIDGILGVDFLGKYAVSVSARDQVVRLYPPAVVAEKAYRSWDSVPMRQLDIGRGDASAYTINLHINGIDVPALLDLGSGANLMNWHAAHAIRVRPKKGNRRKLYGIVDDVSIIANLDVQELKIGPIRWRHRNFLISDFEIFKVLDLEHQPVAIVGPELFRNRDFIIDFVRSRLLIGVRK